MLIYQVASALWGFLVGFVCWSSCFRLVEPISDWLMPLPKKAETARGITRILVMVFAILAVLIILCLVPMFIHQSAVDQAQSWKALFEFAFVSSLAGLFLGGFLRRVFGVRLKK